MYTRKYNTDDFTLYGMKPRLSEVGVLWKQIKILTWILLAFEVLWNFTNVFN